MSLYYSILNNIPITLIDGGCERYGLITATIGKQLQGIAFTSTRRSRNRIGTASQKLAMKRVRDCPLCFAQELLHRIDETL